MSCAKIESRRLRLLLLRSPLFLLLELSTTSENYKRASIIDHAGANSRKQSRKKNCRIMTRPQCRLWVDFLRQIYNRETCRMERSSVQSYKPDTDNKTPHDVANGCRIFLFVLRTLSNRTLGGLIQRERSIRLIFATYIGSSYYRFFLQTTPASALRQHSLACSYTQSCGCPSVPSHTTLWSRPPQLYGWSPYNGGGRLSQT